MFRNSHLAVYPTLLGQTVTPTRPNLIWSQSPKGRVLQVRLPEHCDGVESQQGRLPGSWRQVCGLLRLGQAGDRAGPAAQGGAPRQGVLPACPLSPLFFLHQVMLCWPPEFVQGGYLLAAVVAQVLLQLSDDDCEFTRIKHFTCQGSSPVVVCATAVV